VLQATPPPDGLTVSVGADARFGADPSLMAQMIANLGTNAHQALPDGGELRLAVECLYSGEVWIANAPEGGAKVSIDLPRLSGG